MARSVHVLVVEASILHGTRCASEMCGGVWGVVSSPVCATLFVFVVMACVSRPVVCFQV